jgi:hypothetical protein
MLASTSGGGYWGGGLKDQARRGHRHNSLTAGTSNCV